VICADPVPDAGETVKGALTEAVQAHAEGSVQLMTKLPPDGGMVVPVAGVGATLAQVETGGCVTL